MNIAHDGGLYFRRSAGFCRRFTRRKFPENLGPGSLGFRLCSKPRSGRRLAPAHRHGHDLAALRVIQGRAFVSVMQHVGTDAQLVAGGQ
jgi:hypothetical protein